MFSILGQAMARTVVQTEMTETARGLTVCSNNIFSEVMSCCGVAIMWQKMLFYNRKLSDNR